MSLTFNVSLELPSGAKIQVTPDPAGFMIFSLIAPNGTTVVASESVGQSAATKFLYQLQAMNSARIRDLQS